MPYRFLLFAFIGSLLYADDPYDPSQTYRVTTQAPKLNEKPRAWIDGAGKKAIVGTLTARDERGFVIERADGKPFVVPPINLSESDRIYATLATEPRVTPDARVLLGKVEQIMDADTIKLATISGESITVRLNGIDAPEKKQQHGDFALQWLERIDGYKIRVEFKEPDRYGRILGDVYLGNRWVNLEIALAGIAWHYEKYSNDSRLAAAQEFAKSKKRGIWSADKLIAPWDFRNGVREATEQPMNVVSIRNSDRTVWITGSGTHFHTATCRHAKNGTEIPFSRASSAYEPCGVCKPAP